MKSIIKSLTEYLIYSKNHKPIKIRKAQDKKDAIKKAECLLGVDLIDPKVKLVGYRRN